MNHCSTCKSHLGRTTQIHPAVVVRLESKDFDGLRLQNGPRKIDAIAAHIPERSTSHAKVQPKISRPLKWKRENASHQTHFSDRTLGDYRFDIMRLRVKPHHGRLLDNHAVALCGRRYFINFTRAKSQRFFTKHMLASLGALDRPFRV